MTSFDMGDNTLRHGIVDNLHSPIGVEGADEIYEVRADLDEFAGRRLVSELNLYRRTALELNGRTNVAPMTITFSGADTALMTLPNGRTTNLKRHRF